MNELVREAQALQQQLVEWRRILHQAPETGAQTPQTAAFVSARLAEMGYQPQAVGGGVVATVGTGGKCFLLRADMDALPIAEQTELPFKSTNGNMHACGHDFHTTMLLGAAQLLKRHEERLGGQVKLMFQPGEEVFTGARAMLEAGVLKDPPVHAAAMFHVAVGMPLPAGAIIVPNGGIGSAAADWFEITIQGKGGHGAMPESTVDPLNVAAHLHLALQAILSREISAGATAALTVGRMCGGTVGNVIPDTAVLEGSVRTVDAETRAFILERVKTVSEATAQAFRASADVVFTGGCPAVHNDEGVTDSARRSLTDAFDAAVPPPMPAGHKMGGSEDFAFITEKVPSVMLVLGAGSSEEGYDKPMHHPMARFDESVLAQGAAAYAVVATGWLNENR